MPTSACCLTCCGQRATLFMRRDEADAAWRWCQPVLDHWAAEADSADRLRRGSWGRRRPVV